MKVVTPFRRRWRTDDPLAARLAAEGLLGGRGAAAPSPEASPAEWARVLVRALEGASPALRTFPRWLSGRVDLLPPAACRGLALDRGRARPFGGGGAPVDLRCRLESALGAAADQLAEVDPSASLAGALRSVHRGRTVGGAEVEVVLVRPGAVDGLEGDRTAPLVAALDASGLPGVELLAAFRRHVLLEIDLVGEADVLAELSVDAAAFPALRIPRVVTVDGRRLVSPEVLVREALPGRPLDGSLLGDAPGDDGPREETPVPPEALHRAAFSWLRQGVLGRAFPLRPAGPEVRWLGDGVVAWTGGPFAVLPAASQNQLWSYLVAAVETDPTTACRELLPELTAVDGPRGAGGEEDLLLRLRQVVPFRDGSLGAGVDPLADELFAALRTARQCGFSPRRPLADLAASLCDLALAAMVPTPGQAPVRRAVESLRLERSAEELRRQWDPSALASLPGPYAQLLLELPRKLDDALERLGRGEARVRLEVSPQTRGGAGAGSPALALAAAAVAVWLAAPRVGELLQAGTEGAGGTLAVLLLGALLLGSRLGRD